MKKILFLLLLTFGFANAQILTIPDANFKAKLLSALPTNAIAYSNGLPVKIDFNNDNEIQLSEAIAIDSLNVSWSNIVDLQGINSFLNLKKLVANTNNIVNLDLSSLTFLKYLKCGDNNIANANLTANTNLETIFLNANFLTNVNVTGLTQLKTLDVFENGLFSGTIDTSTLISLESLDVGYTSIQTLDLTQNINLLNLSTTGSEVANLDLSQNLNLQVLDCSYSLLTTINLSQNINLQQFNCSGTLLQTLDLSSCSNLSNFNCQSNSALEFLNIKNGNSGEFGIANFSGTNNLLYVCADEIEIIVMQLNAGPQANVNSYCSFTPGGDYNTISGTTRIDANNSGCDATDLEIPFLSFDVSLDAVDTNAQVFSNSTGNYSFFTGQIGAYALTPNLENPSYFNISPNPATINIPLIDNSTTTQNFCITPNGIHSDLEVVIVPLIPARPGFDAVYKIVYKNKGNQTDTGYVNFSYNDAFLDFVSSSIVPENNGGGFMNWIIPNIAPFQSGSILVTLNVNSPQETPSVNIGDVLAFNAFIDVITDDNWDDNNFDFNQTVVGSYDPNDITCLQGNALATTEMGKYLHYNIRFENTGTYAAENIVVKNEIDLTQYNIQSLQVMESSHPMEVKVTGNIAEFIFQGIDLDTGGHGNILLKLKSNNTLPNGLVVNDAEIFFDYNFPIVTNEEQTVFANLSKNDFVKDASIQVFPNPVNDIINVKADNTINTIHLYDAQGRLLLTKMANENSQVLDLSSYSSGIYFINISTSAGKQTQKIIKN